MLGALESAQRYASAQQTADTADHLTTQMSSTHALFIQRSMGRKLLERTRSTRKMPGVTIS